MAAYRYWQLYITRWRAAGVDGSASGSVRVAEMQFVKADNSTWPLAAMTSNTAPSPYAVSASSELGGFPAWYAFDGVLADAGRWLSAGAGGDEWLSFDMGSAQEFNRVRIAPDGAVSTGGGYLLLDFKLFGSTTGAFAGEQVTYLEVTGATTGWTANTYREFAIAEVLPTVGESDLTLPMLSMSALGGANAGATLPFFSIVAYAGSNAGSTLPALVGAARGGSNAGATLPMLSTEIIGGPGVTPGVTATLPKLAAVALGGANESSALPALQGFATATFYGWSQTAAKLPALQASASGTTGGVAAASAVLPMFVATSQGGANAAATLPALSASSGATVGSVASVAVQLPHLVAGLAATRGNTATVVATLPALQVVNSGVLRATLPALVALASGYAVVTYTYEAYSINLKKTRPDQPAEVTHYTNYPFTQILRYRNAYYGVAADGLYLLGGDTDAGVAIASDWRTHLTDFGSIKLKTPEALYVGGRIGPTATATAVVGEKGDQVYSYATPRTGAQNYRIKLGKGLKSRYYGFGLADPAGGEMDIDTLDIPIDGMSRGI